MDLLNKLNMLMREKGVNKNVLARESGIPYTTIDGLYKKGYENVKLSTLNKLGKYFNVSLDYLIRDNEDGLSFHETTVLHAYRARPDMQPAVDTLLGVKPENKEIRHINEDAADDEMITLEYVARGVPRGEVQVSKKVHEESEKTLVESTDNRL